MPVFATTKTSFGHLLAIYREHQCFGQLCVLDGSAEGSEPAAFRRRLLRIFETFVAAIRRPRIVAIARRVAEFLSQTAKAEIKVLSQIEDIRNQGAEIRIRLRELLRCHEYPSDTKIAFLTGYVDIALEHHEAISLLVDSKLCGSAFALVRPLVETVFRALWINKGADETQIEKASQDKLQFPRLSQMLAEIDQNYATDNFFQSLELAWRAMCSYTHSGSLQIARRFTNGEVKPNYSDAEILEALNATTTALILLTRMFFVSMGCHGDAVETQNMMLKYGAAQNRGDSLSD